MGPDTGGILVNALTRLWLRFWADLRHHNRRNYSKPKKSAGNVKFRNYR